MPSLLLAEDGGNGGHWFLTPPGYHNYNTACLAWRLLVFEEGVCAGGAG